MLVQKAKLQHYLAEIYSEKRFNVNNAHEKAHESQCDLIEKRRCFHAVTSANHAAHWLLHPCTAF